MANCRLKYSQDVINTIYDMVGVGRNSAVITKPNTILLPVGGIDGNNSKLKTKNNTYKWAKSLESEINKHFESHNFGNIITVDNESNQQGTLLYITVPKLLIDAIEVKNGERDREILLKEMEQRDLEGNQKFNEEGDVYYQIGENDVKYTLKAVDILSSDKAKQIFEKGEKNKWDLNKILTELAIAKEQKELILNSGKTKLNDIITDLLANYSYTVEINTAKESKGNLNEGIWRDGKKFEYAGDTYEVKNIGYTPKYFKNNKEISFDEIVEAEEKLLQQTKGTQNTQYYSNLTVPGGTNYTENEISTPLITPSIKGHAQFSTDNGIGWFRSDDKGVFLGNKDWNLSYDEQVVKYGEFDGDFSTEGQYDTSSKTRRILEVQSDLFQKGRDKETLIKLDNEDVKKGFQVKENIYYSEKGKYFKSLLESFNPISITEDEFNKAVSIYKRTDITDAQNNFLQLLNKDNNWVTFFVKSIIQDSAKKGYEKVLFPSGNTASKVEGHTTLEEFKKEKEDRIKELENAENRYDKWLQEVDENGNLTGRKAPNKEIAVKRNFKNTTELIIDRNENEINQLKQELERVEAEGFGALKPIYNFYENTVANILKKQGYNPKLITDEYGNTWNEVTINPIRDNANILLQSKSKSETNLPDQKLKTKLLEFCKKNNIKVEFIDSLLNSFGYDYAAVYNTINQTISIAKSKEKSDTLSEEVGHAVLEGLGDNHVLVKRLYELISQIDYKSQLDPEYITAYKGNSEKLIKELAGQLLSKGIINNFNNVDTTPQIKNILQRIWEYFVSLFKNANQSDLESIKEEINKITDVLAGKILKNENLNLVTPIKPVSLFQINKPKYDKEKYEKHVLLIKRRINSRKQLLKKLKVDSTDYNKVNSEIEALTSELSKFEKTGDIEILYNIGKAALIAVEKYISKLETGKVKLSSDNSDDWSYTEYVIDTFKTFKGLSDQALELEERLLVISETTVEDLVNSHSTEKDKVTYEKVMSQNQDINRFSLMFGALVDLGDYLARTIGSLIKEAQNKISSFQKKLATDIEKERDLLLKWAKDNGLNEDNMYDIFIQDFKNTTVLTREYSSEWYENLSKAFREKNYGWIDDNAVKDDNGKFLPIDKKKWSNPNYKKIQSTPELKRFYEFYQKTIKEAFDKLPVNNRTDFIPNIYKQTVSDIIKTSPTVSSKLKGVVSAFTGVSSKHTTENGYVNNEELEADVVPFKYIKSIDASKKSKNLADVLYKFGAFAESHNILSDVLPKARLLQKHIQKKKYIKSSSPNEGIAGINTNLNEMVKKVIDMQIKDKMKLDEIKLPIKSIYNDKGEKIGEKYIHMSDVVDYGLRYNSVLRIGLNPLNAVVNVLVGDIGNIVEGFGGRYYSLKELKKATDIYTTQRLKDNSKLINIMGILNPLQEMEDYQLSKNLSSKKVDIDKAKNFMYAPQRMGEDFLQTRTMIAIMLKTKLPGTNVSVWDAMGEDGNLKKEYINNFKDNKEIEIFLNRITDKVQRVNQMIHGRYSERDAATIQQSVLWRMIFQFKKWIPAAIEQRFGKFQEHDSRLGDSIEGRWRTAYRLFTKAYLEKSLKSLQAGNMTELELYNMRKNLAELAIFAGVILLSGMLGWDDDDERKRNPYYKMTMSTLDRVSGDLLFFANPKEQTRLVNSSISMASTVKDMIKVFETIPYALFGEEDKRKTSLPERIAKVIPGAKPAKEVFEFFNEERYKNYSGS